jgi:hypothetical protein
MADPYPSEDGNDLPRTVRQQQKEARARDQVAREILNAPKPAYAREAQQANQRAAQTAAPPPPAATASSLSTDFSRAQDYAQPMRLPPGEFAPASVARFQVPFLHLVGFFIKAALAAVPALLLLGGLFWVLGQVAKTYMPWLLKMQVLITFPG